MRKFVVVLVLILIIAAALPGAAGYWFKQQYLSLLAANGGDPSKITVVEYHEYWLTSDAVVTVNLDSGQKSSAGQTNVPQTLTLYQHITHGPYIKNIDTNARQFALAHILTEAHLDKSFESKLNVSSNGIMQSSTWVSFFNKYSSLVQTPVFAVKLPNQTRITWQGMKGSVEAEVSNNQVKVLKSDFLAGPLSLQAAGGSFAVNSMQTQGERDCDANTLCSGSGSFKVPVMISTTADHSVKISGFDFDTQFGVDAENNYNGDLTIALAHYETPDYFLGPLQFKFTVSNMNADELKKLVDISRQASANMSSGEDVHASELMLLAQYNDVLPHLIRANSTLTQSAAIKTSYGNATEHAKIFWPPKTPLPVSSTDIAKASVNLGARASTSLVDQVINMIDEKNASGNVIAIAPAPATAAVGVADTGKPQNFEASIYLLIGQGLPQDEEKNLVLLEKKNVSRQVFNSYVDSRVTIKAIPANLAETIKQDYVNAAMSNPQQNVAALAGANKQLDDWVNQNKITSDTRTKLIALQKQHLSPEIYGASINDIVRARRLPLDLAVQLKAQYAANAPADSMSGLGEDTTDISAGATAPAATVVQASGETRLQFDSWIRSGYVKQDKDDYIVDVVYEGGVLKVNGIVVPLEAQDQVPALPAQ